jgi:hypothetical protein
MTLTEFKNKFFEPGGTNIEIPFKEFGIKPGDKVGYRDALTEYRKHARAISKFRRQNPIAPNQADLVNWLLYDRYTVAASGTVPTNFKFFTAPIGSGTKTKADTNLDQVQRLPDPLWMNVVGIGFYFANNMALVDVTGFLNTYYMEFWVGQKVYIEGPHVVYPSASGLSGTASGIITNGFPNFNNMFDLRLVAGLNLGAGMGSDGQPKTILSDGLTGITILQGQQFRVENNAPAGGLALAASPATGLNIMCYLYGILSRGVQ